MKSHHSSSPGPHYIQPGQLRALGPGPEAAHPSSEALAPHAGISPQGPSTLGLPPQLTLSLQALPYSLLALAVVMYLPVLLWQYAAVPALSSDLLFIISELDKSYNRSIRLVQHMVKIKLKSSDPHVFWDELEK